MSNTRLEQLFTFLETSPKDSFVLYAIATEYIKLNDADKAIFYFEELLAGKPDYVGAYYHFGRLYESLGRKEEAIETYQKGMLVAKQANDYHALSELQLVYQSALGIDPEDEDW